MANGSWCCSPPGNLATTQSVISLLSARIAYPAGA
jgi:predicted proteasome-type protease